MFIFQLEWSEAFVTNATVLIMSLWFSLSCLFVSRNMEEEKRNSSNVKKEENQLIQVIEKWKFLQCLSEFFLFMYYFIL